MNLNKPRRTDGSRLNCDGQHKTIEDPGPRQSGPSLTTEFVDKLLDDFAQMGESTATSRSDHDSGDGILDLDFAAGSPESPGGGVPHAARLRRLGEGPSEQGCLHRAAATGTVRANRRRWLVSRGKGRRDPCIGCSRQTAYS